MKVRAKSPGKNFSTRERVSSLMLSADNVGEAIDLAAINEYIDDDGEEAIERLAELARSLTTARTTKWGGP